MSYGQIESTAVEIPSPRFMPVVVGSIAALAVVGFVLGLSAADDGGGAAVTGDLSNAATLAGAPLASPIVLNSTEAPPPPVAEPEETEEVETAEAPAAPEAPPPAPVAAPAPVEAAPAAPTAAPPTAAEALY